MFDGDQVDLAYEGGDLACRVVAEKYGQKALVRFYRLVRRGRRDGEPEPRLGPAGGHRLGSTSAFETAWHARLRALAA